jgi:16S rRNA (adenine1518-N6/adenine1519-N6)-dimethyltransferase
MIEALNIQPGDVILEIGPGDGIVTKEILTRGAQVLCIEIDYSLLPNLIKRFSGHNNFHLIHQDILKINISEELLKVSNDIKNYKVIGSLPFNISKKIISLFFNEFIRAKKGEIVAKPTKMVFILQEEVSKVYNAKLPHMTMLSTLSELFCTVKKLQSIPAHQFYPEPKVDGGITSFTFKSEITLPNIEKMQKFIKLGYKSPRKTLLNNLKIYYPNVDQIFSEMNIDTKIRPSQTSIDIWYLIASKLFANI